jgi:hypothetical protein
LKMNRQFRFDGPITHPVDGRMYLMLWYDAHGRNPAEVNTTAALFHTLQVINYFREP